MTYSNLAEKHVSVEVVQICWSCIKSIQNLLVSGCFSPNRLQICSNFVSCWIPVKIVGSAYKVDEHMLCFEAIEQKMMIKKFDQQISTAFLINQLFIKNLTGSTKIGWVRITYLNPNHFLAKMIVSENHENFVLGPFNLTWKGIKQSNVFEKIDSSQNRLLLLEKRTFLSQFPKLACFT